ncbi:hypothetical protein B5S31_g4667 [[Candida] boidinii]|nr:hypothetical protein B5S31_g4667 [[Candida] boidinii]OWB80404.1 hypothetical protein B5S32_g4679 [[Candida] boidinii]
MKKNTDQLVETTHDLDNMSHANFKNAAVSDLKVESIDVNFTKRVQLSKAELSSSSLPGFEPIDATARRNNDSNSGYELEALDANIQSERVQNELSHQQTNNNSLRGRRTANITAVNTNQEETPLTSELTDYDEGIEYPDGGTRAWIVLFGAFLGFIADFGLINSIGAIQAYISVHQLAGVSSATTAWIFSLFLGCSYCAGIVSGILFDETGVKIPFILGTILTVGGLLITANAESIGSFIGGFGVVCGIGCALCMNPLMGVVSHWFKKKRAMAIGLATLGGSIGGIVFPLMLNSLYSRVGFVWAIRTLAFTCLGLLCLSFLMIKERLSANISRNDIDTVVIGEEETPSNEEQNILAKSTKMIKKSGSKIWKYSKEAISFKYFLEPKFLFCTIAAAFSELSLVCSMTYFASYAILLGQSENTAFILLTIINALGVLGRYLSGVLADKYGVYNVMIVMIFGVFLSNIVIWLGICSTMKSAGGLYAYAVIFGFFSSAVLSLTPACCGAISPTKDFGKRFATMYFFGGFNFIGGITLGGVILGKETLKTYNNFIIYCGVLAFAGDLCWIIARYFIVGVRLNVRV